jgi:site-specific recombinase XerD
MDEILTWEECIDAFLAHKRVTTKPRTAEFYASRMGRLLAYVESRRPHIEVAKFGRRHMDAYGVERLARVSRATWRHDVVACREFFAYVAAEFREETGWRHSPLDRYTLPDAPVPHVGMPTDADLRALLRAIEERQDARKNPKVACRGSKELKRVKLRDMAIARLLITTGARVGEIIRLDVEDYDRARSEVVFRETKGNRPRVVSVEKRAADSVEAWLVERDKIAKLTDRRGNLLLETAALFVSKTGVPLELRGTERRFELYRRYAGLTGWTLHGLRHWAVTTLIDRSDVETAQQVVGHKSAATTARYDHRTKERAKQRHKEAGLLGGLENGAIAGQGESLFNR